MSHGLRVEVASLVFSAMFLLGCGAADGDGGTNASSEMTSAQGATSKPAEVVKQDPPSAAKTPKQEPAKQEPAKQEPAKQEPAKQEPGETPKVEAHPALMNPDLAQETAPPKFRVRFETTKGPFVVEAVREWAPHGVDRFYSLAKIGYFTDVACFRVVAGFVVQFGMHGNPDIHAAWSGDKILDDPVAQSNRRGYVTFAMAGPNTRSNQFFVNLSDRNSRLDAMGFPAFGHVVEGMAVVDELYSGYGDGPPQGRGPNQGQIQAQGNEYLRRQFPLLDYIKSATLVK